MEGDKEETRNVDRWRRFRLFSLQPFSRFRHPVPQPPAWCRNKRSGLGAEGSLRQQEHTRNTSNFSGNSKPLARHLSHIRDSWDLNAQQSSLCSRSVYPACPALMDGTKVTAYTASMLSPKSSINTQACGANCSLFLSPYAIDLTITQQRNAWGVAHFRWVSGS